MLELFFPARLQNANASYSRVAQCEAKMEDLQTENERYDLYCDFLV